MKLSASTLAILKNFASINPSLLFKEGSQQDTISLAKNVFASATVADSFPAGFGVYDLTEFLNTLSLFKDPDIEFKEGHCIISDGSNSCRYNYSEASLIVSPPAKKLSLPSVDVKFTITQDNFEKLVKAASVMGLPDIVVTNASGELSVGVIDKSVDSSNGYFVPAEGDHVENTFTAHLRVDILKVLPCDYEVSISSKLISLWVGESQNVEYFVALEKSSSFS